MLVVAYLLGTAVFIYFAWRLEKMVMGVVMRHRRMDERISSLETQEFQQDIILHDVTTAVSDHSTAIRALDTELSELGKDVGWSDSERVTETLDIHTRDTPIVEPPKE